MNLSTSLLAHIITPILTLLYLFLPAYVANGSPPLLAKLLPWWNAPVDLSARLRGRRLFGSHKTWRGLLLGTLLGGLVFLGQQAWLPVAPVVELPWYAGFLLGGGALLGDLVESMIKRQAGVKPGKPFLPWDQLDYTIGALIFLAPFYWVGWASALFLLVFNGLLSAGSHFVGHRLGLVKGKV